MNPFPAPAAAGRHLYRCDGQVDLAVTATQLPDTPQPLKGTLNVEVYEFGGRPVIESIDLPIRNRDVWLGIKPLFSGSEVTQDSRRSSKWSPSMAMARCRRCRT
jgi:uncharacterized protein YfaS (alpha-2-macroglobulin family)